jgi:hypothetical protein
MLKKRRWKPSRRRRRKKVEFTPRIWLKTVQNSQPFVSGLPSPLNYFRLYSSRTQGSVCYSFLSAVLITFCCHLSHSPYKCLRYACQILPNVSVSIIISGYFSSEKSVQQIFRKTVLCPQSEISSIRSSGLKRASEISHRLSITGDRVDSEHQLDTRFGDLLCVQHRIFSSARKNNPSFGDQSCRLHQRIPYGRDRAGHRNITLLFRTDKADRA